MAKNSNLPNKIPKIIIEEENNFWVSRDTEGNYFGLPTRKVEVFDYFHYDEQAVYENDIINGFGCKGIVEEKEASQEDLWDKLRHEDDEYTWEKILEADNE